MCKNVVCSYPFEQSESELQLVDSTNNNDNTDITKLQHKKNSLSDSGVGESTGDDIGDTCVDVNTYLEAEDVEEQTTEEDEQEHKIHKLLEDSSKLVTMLNNKKHENEGKKNKGLTDSGYIKQLLNIQKNCKIKQSLVSKEELRIMRESERIVEMNEKIELNIMLPSDQNSLLKIDILQS